MNKTELILIEILKIIENKKDLKLSQEDLAKLERAKSHLRTTRNEHVAIGYLAPIKVGNSENDPVV